jgi:drug/metabolite transporter (DMT)-like permease
MIVDSDKIPRSIPARPARTRKNKTGRIMQKISGIMQNIPLDLVIAVLVWYLVGVGCICTSKMLLSEYSLPPLVLTFQQLLLGSTMLRLHLGITGGLQPLPEDKRQQHYSIYYDFVLMGLFNALDFLASNTSFSHSAASFVETVKASEPITTTAIALFFGLDSLRLPEAMSMGILIVGVLCATLGNMNGDESSPAITAADEELSLHQSAKTCVIVMTANLCFALRAKSQKVFRSQPEGQVMNDANLLMRIQQVGALSMLVPVIIFELPGVLERTMDAPLETHGHFWFLAIANAMAFFTYCLASCYVLTKLSIVQYTLLGCMRRMFAIISTSIAFGVTITLLGALGIVLCFCGFCCFSHFRSHPPMPPMAAIISTPPSKSHRMMGP